MRRKPPEGSVRRPQFKGNNLRGAFTSKTGRSVQFESEAEHALILRLDRDPSVREYGTWPETYHIHDPEVPGKPHSYTPQCMVWRYDGAVEIHRVVRLDQWSQTGQALGDVLGPHLSATHGWHYITHRAEELTAETPYANLLALVRYRPTGYAQPPVTYFVQEQLHVGQDYLFHMLVADIVAALDLSPPLVIAALCHLLWHSVLETNLNHLLFLFGTIDSRVLLRLPSTSPRLP